LEKLDMKRFSFFIFGVHCHGLFLIVFAYMAAFVGNLFVPKSIDSGGEGTVSALAVGINLLLLAAFSVPHSVMARPAFKRWWTQFVPAPIERSVYVFVSCILMIALLVFWQPITLVVWDFGHPVARGAMWAMFAAGWLLIPLASLMINHFDLFGTRQVWLHLRGREYTHLPFRTPMLYKIVRHPLYVGWMIAFWATPTMTVGHLLFAVTLTAYMLIAIPVEERDLVEAYGKTYVNYRRRVPGLIPSRGVAVSCESDLIAAPSLQTRAVN
jgi:methanethiol S-methyltransferase